jgi:outer membrane protein assembly factor BamB
MVISPANADQYWGKRLLSPVTAQPAASNGVLYVAGKDQYLHALDLANGRTLWRKLFESPLTESPVVVGDKVYQQVPSEGLVCFEAIPVDSPGGKIVWKSKETKGNVILRRRDNLFVWDAVARRLTVLDVAHGSLVRTLNLPKVKYLTVPGGAESKNGDIFAAGDDCRVVRLVPRN